MSAREAAAFLDHIWAHPADDAPRLIYADWLQEHGDPDRAEFIRLQCERARLPRWEARHVALGFRERDLLKRHAKRWAKEVPTIKGVTWTEFRRGFPAAVGFGTFAALVANAAAVWAAAPVEAATVRWPRKDDGAEAMAPIPGLRELTVTGTVVNLDDVARLAASPLLSTLRVLTVRQASLGIEGFRRLAWSSHLGRLEALRVPFNSIGNEAVGALAKTAILPALAELDLSEIGSYGRYGEDPIITVDGMEQLAAWPGLARVHTLTLSGNDIGRAGLRALLRSPRATGLKHLAVRNNGLNGSALREFAAARAGLELEKLDLGENVLYEEGDGHLAKARCLRGLRVLLLDECEIGLATARTLATAPFLAGLRVLHVNHNYFEREALEALLAARPPHLHTLRIAGNGVGDDGVALLAASPAAEPLVRLDLGGNALGDPAAVELARSAHLPNLLALTLTGNRISPAAVATLRRSPLGKRLAQLDEPNGPAPAAGDDIPF